MLTERERARGVWGRTTFTRMGPSILRVVTETFSGVEDERAPNANCLVGHVLLVLSLEVEGLDFDLDIPSEGVGLAPVSALVRGDRAMDLWLSKATPEQARAIWESAWPKLLDTLRRLVGTMGSVVETETWDGVKTIYLEYGPRIVPLPLIPEENSPNNSELESVVLFPKYSGVNIAHFLGTMRP